MSPIFGVLNSIMSLMLITQPLGHPELQFSGSRPTVFSPIATLLQGSKNGLFYLECPDFFKIHCSRQLGRYSQRHGTPPPSFSQIFYLFCGAYGASPDPCIAPCVRAFLVPMCLPPYVIRILCM